MNLVGVSQSIREALLELERRLNKLLVGNLNLEGRRVMSAGDAVEPRDLVTLRQLQDAVRGPTVAPVAGSGTAGAFAGPVNVGTANAEGSSPYYSRSDHVHNAPPFVASGVSHAQGQVPDPGAVAASAKFLREDATWALPPGAGSGLTHWQVKKRVSIRA